MDDVFDDWPEPDFDAAEIEPRHDPKVDEAAVKLLGFIEENPGQVFYGMQLEVIFERDSSAISAKPAINGRIKSGH